MSHDEKIGAGEFASRLGVSPETLRNWRRIGIALGNAAVNGRVSYGNYDIFAGTLMLHLHRAMFELGDAWRISQKVSPWLASSMGIEVPGHVYSTAVEVFSGDYPKYALVTYGSNTILTDNASDLDSQEQMVTSVVRLDILAEVMSKTVSEL